MGERVKDVSKALVLGSWRFSNPTLLHSPRGDTQLASLGERVFPHATVATTNHHKLTGTKRGRFCFFQFRLPTNTYLDGSR